MANRAAQASGEAVFAEQALDHLAQGLAVFLAVGAFIDRADVSRRVLQFAQEACADIGGQVDLFDVDLPDAGLRDPAQQRVELFRLVPKVRQ
jgi:hypothetical protein